MNIEATADLITSARHSDAFDREACVKIIHNALERLERSRDFYKRRCDALQRIQSEMRDPERKWVCEILANGQTYVEPDAAQPQPSKASSLPQQLNLPCGCTIEQGDSMKSSVFWNEFNRVVQCHKCGQVYEPASPLGERSELGNHDCEYDSDGSPCNHCGRTASEAIMYFERRIRKQRSNLEIDYPQRSDQPPSLAKATDDKQEWTLSRGYLKHGDSLYPSISQELADDINAALADSVSLRYFHACNKAKDEAHAKALAAERKRREQAEQELWTMRAGDKVKDDQLLSALAAIEKHNDLIDKGHQSVPIHVDLSALDKHDAEARKPLVDDLKLIGDELGHVCKALQSSGFRLRPETEAALSKAKEGK